MVSRGVMVFVYRGLKKNTDAACGAGLRSLCMVLLRGNHNQTSAHGGTVRSRRGSPVWLCIALYGNVRCPGRGHDIVKSHTARYRGRAHDITTRVRYRAAIVLSCVCAISFAGRDIVRPLRAISQVRVVISYASPRYRGQCVVSCQPALS